MLHKLLGRQQGFTLLELLIVIVIIGILAVIIVPGLASGPRRARDAERKADLRTIQNALETYYTDEGGYPAAGALTGELVSAYLPEMPADPSGGDYTYTPAPSGCASGDCTSYVLGATLENEQDPAGPDYTVESVN